MKTGDGVKYISLKRKSCDSHKDVEYERDRCQG